jgi:hypothetical protein
MYEIFEIHRIVREIFSCVVNNYINKNNIYRKIVMNE